MAPISLKKGKIDLLGTELIKKTLRVESGDQNIKVALEYVMSNFRYHRFLDINPLDVSRSLTGLTSKFRVNSQDKKAKYLEDLVEKFVSLPLLETDKEEKETQTDAHYSLLYFLINLSNNPLNSKFSPIEEKQAEIEPKSFDWKSYLLEDEESFDIGVPMDDHIQQELYDSDEELWRLSEDEASDIEEEEEPLYAEINELNIRKKTELVESTHEEDIKWLEENISPPYWNEIHYHQVDHSNYKYGNEQMCNNWELYMRLVKGSSQVNLYQLLTEKQLVRETLWLLQGVENLHVYKFIGDKYVVNENIVVSHLTRETLISLLSRFTMIGTKVFSLKRFSTNTALDVETQSKTFRAFGYVVGRFLMERQLDMSHLEKQVIDCDETITLSVLYDKLFKDFTKVECVHQLYEETIVKGFHRYSTVTERVVYLLDIFYSTICMFDSLGDSGLDKMLIILPMFLDICQPYLHDLEGWMTMGKLPHSDEEFMIYKLEEKEKGNVNYWSETFKIKESKEKSLVPKFIQGVQKQILVAGKSLGLLSEFGKFAQNVLSSKSLFDEFKENLKAILVKSNNRFLKGSDLPIGEYVVDGKTSIIDHHALDPLIKENFNTIFLDDYKLVKQDKLQRKSTLCREEYIDWTDLLEHGSCRPPIQLLLAQSLQPVIIERYDKASALLLELFKHEENLFYHISVMKDFFLAQAGGTMYEFYSEVFEKIKRKDFHDMAFLNIVLQDALQSQHPQLMGSLTIVESNISINTYSTKLDGLELRYEVPWPITIIVNDDIQARYNEIFKFLLKVKRAIWTLEQLRFHELTSGSIYNKETGEESCDEDEPIRISKKNLVSLTSSQQQLKTRMLIIRMKIMHVMRNFHFYLMTRIESTVTADVEGKLKEAKDLDEIINIHLTFLNNLKQRCFLHEKIERSREAILRIVYLVFDFEGLWLEGVQTADGSKLNKLEKDFNRCTSFLHSFFSSIAKRGSYPHFEFLANSLKTESRGHHALFRR